MNTPLRRGTCSICEGSAEELHNHSDWWHIRPSTCHGRKYGSFVPDTTKTYKVRVRLGFEGEYEITTGTDGYGGATDLQTCIEIDRNQFLNDDTHLLLDAVNASPVYFVLISSSEENTGEFND